MNESIQGEVDHQWVAATVVSGDGGHGLFQLTSSYPPDWQEPQANAMFACLHFLMPAEAFWTSAPYSFTGDTLVRAIAATFNAGLGHWYGPNDRHNAGALGGHGDGNVDKFTSND